MFSSGAQEGVGLDLGSLTSEKRIGLIQERMGRYMEMVRTGASESALKEAQSKLAEAIGKERFEIIRQLPHFMKQAAKSVDAAKVYRQFRLPGRDRIVYDRRDQPKGEPKEAEPKAEAKAKTEEGGEARKRPVLELKEGRLIRQKGKGRTGFFGDRSRLGSSLEQRAASDRVDRLLSAFERLVLARFEEGAEVAKESPDGKPHFLEKSEGDWRSFFARFFQRTVKKRVLLSEIREFLFRGLVQKGNRAVVISDMTLMNGRIEKFIRFNVFAEALAKLKAMTPGEAFSQAALAGLSGEELIYLALAVARAREFVTSPRPAEGKFMSGQAEARAAAELGIALEGQLDAKARMLRRRAGGLFGLGGFDEREGRPEDTPYHFIPWWHWGSLFRPGRWRWTTVIFYLALLAVAAIGISVMTSRLLR